VAGPVAGSGEARARGARRERHAHAVREALPERSGRDLDARRVAVLRMTRRPRTELAEVREVVEREPVPVEMEQRVQEHRSVAVGEDEAVAQRPRGIARIEAQMAVPEL